MATETEKRNMELMQTLDDAWNAQDLNVFKARHKPNVVVRWPGKIEPTVGIKDHTQEAIDSFSYVSQSASRQPTLQGFSCLWKLDLLDSSLQGNNDRAHEDPRWQGNSAHGQEL